MSLLVRIADSDVCSPIFPWWVVLHNVPELEPRHCMDPESLQALRSTAAHPLSTADDWQNASFNVISSH